MVRKVLALALGEILAGASEVWRAKADKDLYRASGMRKSFGLFSLAHQGVAKL